MPGTRRWLVIPISGLALVALAAAAIVRGGSTAGQDCDRVAAPADGAQALLRDLEPGETGCLRGGTYASDRTIVLRTPRITLTSYPRERATIVGRVLLTAEASGVTVEGLTLDGRNDERLPSPTVNADRATFRENDVTNRHTAICFLVDDGRGERPSGVIIERNRIHDCGKLPATNHHHGIYLADAMSTVIRGNVIFRNADRGIQLFPNADGSEITGNVIDGNGQGIIFSGAERETSSNNLVEGNLVTNSTIRYNVEAHWGGKLVGQGNVVRGNCIWGGARDRGSGGIEEPHEGFVARDNVIADPIYAARGAGDFRLHPASPCREVLAGGA